MTTHTRQCTCVLSTVAKAVIYKMLPDVPLSLRDVWTGALITAGSVVALLLWVYYCAQIFFLGAEFTKQYALRYGSLRPQQGMHLSSQLQ